MSQEKETELAEAIAQVTAAPEAEIASEEAWDRIEDLAGTLDAPDSVAAAYRECLNAELSPEIAVELGKRAARFHEEWYGDDRSGLADLLTRVLELSPKSEWAFQELSVILTVGERWDDAIALYNTVIERTSSKARKIKLLDEAYQVAKDLANRPDQAIDFLKAKLDLEPSDKQLQALERLLERHERWDDLIQLWRDALGEQEPPAQVATLARIAETYFDKLLKGEEAHEALREVLNIDKGHQPALDLLEKIATWEDFTQQLRTETMDTLRSVYEATDRQQDIVRVLGDVLPLCTEEQRKGLHAELGERLSQMEEHNAALEHYASLLILDPASVATQRAMRREAQLISTYDRYAAALAAAAENAKETARKVTLFTDAATAQLELVENRDAAIELFLSALSVEGIKNSEVLSIGKRVNLLLEDTGRHSEHLQVLEQMADAETVPLSRRALIGDLATLAEAQGEVDRALAAWRRRIESNPGDLRALDATIELLNKDERWAELIEALRARTEQDIADNQKRSDLVRIATTFEEKLEDRAQALDAWAKVQELYGDTPETIAALSRLMTHLERWSELTDLLENSNAKQVSYLAEQFSNLGNAYRESLGDDIKAIECYRRALAVDLRQEGAREGLKRLLEKDETRNVAAEALVHSLRSSGDTEGLLDIVEARIAGTDERNKHAEILREAADIAQDQVADSARALGYVTRLFPLTPRDRVMEERMVSLAREQDSWEGCLKAYEEAEAALEGDTYAVTQMRFREAQLREAEVGDNAGALQCCLQVIAAQSDHHEAIAAVIRLAGPESRFTEMVAAVLNYAQQRDAIPEDLMTSVVTFADTNDGGWAELCSALSASIPNSGLSKRNQAELYWRVANWQLHDLDPEGAMRSLLKSVELDPNRVDSLSKLFELQNVTPDLALYKTLQRLCEIDRDELVHFTRAAELACEHLDTDKQSESLTALYVRAAGAWRGTEPAESEREPQSIVTWAIEKLVELYLGTSQAQRALDLLVEASRLPFSQETRLEMRNRAARIASHDLKDNSSAIDMYRAVLAVAPDDALALASLADLYTQEERLPELLGLKRQELAHVSDPENALALRLEISALIDRIDQIGGRLELLRSNLKEIPGHRPTIGALTILLTETGRYRQLSALLSDQATQLENKSEMDRSAELWEQVATICEKQLSDIDNALTAYRKVANLAPNLNALDSLARLYTERGQSAAAVPWLEQALGFANDSLRPTFVKRLAEAHENSGHHSEAVACLKDATASDETPVPELRLMLASFYREDKKWAPLAATLTAALPFIQDQKELAGAAREAANIYHENLGMPGKALPALTRALELIPDDKSLRLMMARSQRVSGDLESAREKLEGLIEDFGRRRSKERAAVHVELAQVARAETKLEEAKTQLEMASKMDAGNSHILRALADLAREQGDLDQAERSLRALLLIVRRQPPGDNELAVGISEVLFELHHIAAVRDDEEKSEELMESVVEAASASDAEVRRLRRTLLDHNEHELLARVLRSRIEVTENVESKASLLEHLAALLEQELDDPKASLEARLEAIKLLPMNADLHDTARVLAGQLGRIETYLDTLEDYIKDKKRAEDSEVSYALLMRAGQVAENELNDLTRARDHFSAAEGCKDNPADALFALARVCAAQGDTNEQARALDDLTNLAVSDGPVLAQADALYRLAELQVAQPDLVERGLGLLRKAIEIEPRYRQAALTLKTAADSTSDAPEVLEQYEKAARQSGDRQILLDFLARQAQNGDTEAVKEAVEVATDLGEHDRAVQLLESSVEQARDSEDGLASASWASIELARAYAAAGVIESARDLLFECAHLAQTDELMALGLEIANKAIADEERPLAARVLEFLRERSPSREIWMPLLGLYRDMGAGAKLITVVDATLPTLVDPQERNTLRVDKGRYLVEAKEDEQAIDVLREALLEDPDCLEAAGLLEQVLRREGHEEALSDFLWQRFQEACSRGNVDSVTDVAVRLGGLLDTLGGDSVTIFKQALEVAPERKELLEGLLSRLGEESDVFERATLTERLVAQEEGDRAAQLALSLVDLRKSLNDDAGVQHALELGQAASPQHEGIRQRLEQWYQDSDQFGPLAQMKIDQAEVETEVKTRVALLREAASIHQDHLGDFYGCTSILAQALDVEPGNESLASELASAYASSGQTDKAIEAIAKSLDHIEGEAALPLLLMGSDLLRNLQRYKEAIENLERALPLDRELVQPMLLQALEASRVGAQATEDIDTERTMTMRLIDLYDENGDEEGARRMLLTWIERDSADISALHRLRDMDKAAERWDGVVAACTHLVGMRQGEEQATDALLLADAAMQIGAFDHARAGLERAHDDQPENEALRKRLRALYEEIGAHRELASLLLADADNTDDEDSRYEKFRAAASIYVNELGDAEAAIDPAQRAKELRPDDHGTVVLLADVLVGSGKLDEAVNMLEPAIAAHKRRSPELAELQHRMAKVSAAQGDQAEQLSWLKKAFDVDRKDGLIASELAHLATELGDYDLALKPLRAITLMENPSPVSRVMALLWEAKIEHARGNRAKAELWAKKALREDPEYAEAEDFLAQIAE